MNAVYESRNATSTVPAANAIRNPRRGPGNLRAPRVRRLFHALSRALRGMLARCDLSALHVQGRTLRRSGGGKLRPFVRSARHPAEGARQGSGAAIEARVAALCGMGIETSQRIPNRLRRSKSGEETIPDASRVRPPALSRETLFRQV